MRYMCAVIVLAACPLFVLSFGSVAGARPGDAAADPSKQAIDEVREHVDFGLAKRIIDSVLGEPECGAITITGKFPTRCGTFLYRKAGLAISFGDAGITRIQLLGK